MNANDDAPGIDADEIRFMQLVMMFEAAAMQHLGKRVNPLTNEVERDLDQARASIDILEMLKRRTEGNRSHAETEHLDKVLFELHMNYVDEVRAKDEKKTKDGNDTGESASSGGGTAPQEEPGEPDDDTASSDTADPQK
jgi:hypothetical protein